MMRGDICPADRAGRMDAGKAFDQTGYELTPPRAGQADLGVRILWGPDSASTRHPPLEPLPDPLTENPVSFQLTVRN